MSNYLRSDIKSAGLYSHLLLFLFVLFSFVFFFMLLDHTILIFAEYPEIKI